MHTAQIENQMLVNHFPAEDIDTDSIRDEFEADAVEALDVIVNAKAESNKTADIDAQVVARLHDGLFLELVKAREKGRSTSDVFSAFMDELEREFVEVRSAS